MQILRVCARAVHVWQILCAGFPFCARLRAQNFSCARKIFRDPAILSKLDSRGVGGGGLQMVWPVFLGRGWLLGGVQKDMAITRGILRNLRKMLTSILHYGGREGSLKNRNKKIKKMKIKKNMQDEKAHLKKLIDNKK